MAEKKASKKTTETPNLPLDQQLVAKRNDLQTMRKSFYDGTLQNPHAIKTAKKEIARIMTQLNQKKGEK